MTKPKIFRLLLLLSTAMAAVYLWLKFVQNLPPQPYDELDGEGEGELDPDLPNARPGDILLFNRAKGLNRLITWFTRSTYYHVGISMGDNHVVEARPRGVVVRDLMGPDGDKRFEIIPAEKAGGREVAEKALEWAQTQIGEGYDPFNVLAIVVDRTFTCCAFNATLPNRWACGEFVATAFAQAGENLFPEKNPAAVVPADFAPLVP
jgi:uncharacterized protein YycO